MHAGGKVAIIIDSKNENISNFSMADDGSGAGISIPSVLIGKKDGDALTSWIKGASDKIRKDVKVNVHFNSL